MTVLLNRSEDRQGCKYLEKGSRGETKNVHQEARERRTWREEERSEGKKEKSRRVDWRGKKSRQSLEYQTLLWPREKEERRGGVAVREGEHPQNTKERITASRLFKSFSHQS